MKLGFIGTGTITSAVVKGILKSKIKYKKINISKRNSNKSRILKKLNNKISIFNNNQEIINNSDWIFLSVTPKVGNKILKKLNFKKDQIIISFISTIKLKDLKKFINVNAKIVRAIPLPPISLGKGPVPIFPSNNEVRSFFDKIGQSIVINKEKASLNFWATSSLMAPFYELLNTTAKWLTKKGLSKKESQKYVSSLFLALSEDAFLNSKSSLDLIVKNSQTPKGLNESTLKYLRNKKFYRRLNESLDSIYKKLNKK